MALVIKARIDLHEPQLHQLLSGPTGPVLRFVRSLTRRIRTRAVLGCPVDTGRLRAAHREEVGTRLGHVYGAVINDVEYAETVHDGSRPHIIRPRHPGGVLRFDTGGTVVFCTRVNHPGSPGTPWLREAMEHVAVPAGFRITHR